MILFSMKKKYNHLLPDGFKPYQLAIYIIMLALCFLFFQHKDLYHTIVSAEGYLNGHFLDFYTYNQSIVGANDYFPVLYIIFALWLLPLKIVGLLAHITVLPINPSDVAAHGIVIAWSKLLLVTSFAGIAFVIYKISNLLTDGDRKTSTLTAAIFATNPIAVFAVFIFGQYDVIGLLITMIGFYYYLQKDLLKFSLLFSMAISCKLFPIIIFIPLLLLSEKKPSQLLKYTAIAVFLPLLQIALYWHNEIFRSYTLFGGVAARHLGWLTELSLSNLLHAPYLIIFFIIICLYTYIKEPNDEHDRQKTGIFVTTAAYGVFFSTVVWNPQWLICITPFFALSSLYFIQKEKLYLIELFGVCAYFFIVVSCWPQNVDASMLQSGLLRDLFTSEPIVLANLLTHDLGLPVMNLGLSVMKAVFLVYLFSPLLIFVFQKNNAMVIASKETQNKYFNCRFILGLAFFLVPNFYCGLAPIWFP